MPSEDHQPEIYSTRRREDVQRIMGQTNKDCRFRIFILTFSPHQQHLFVGRQDSKLRYVLVHQFPTETMLWIKGVEMVESVDDLKSSCSICQILKYSMRRLLQRSVWRNKKPTKRNVSFVADRSLT